MIYGCNSHFTAPYRNKFCKALYEIDSITQFYLFDQHAGKRCVRGVEDFPHDEGLEVSPDHWAIGHLDNGFIQILTERTWTDKQGKMNIRMQ